MRHVSRSASSTQSHRGVGRPVGISGICKTAAANNVHVLVNLGVFVIMAMSDRTGWFLSGEVACGAELSHPISNRTGTALSPHLPRSCLSQRSPQPSSFSHRRSVLFYALACDSIIDRSISHGCPFIARRRRESWHARTLDSIAQRYQALSAQHLGGLPSSWM